MGYFTWFLSEDRRKKLNYGGKGYIALPDGTFIEESHYFGYGMFGSHDAYDVVVDMNKEYLDKIYKKIEEMDGPSYWGRETKEIALAYMTGGKEAAQKTADSASKVHPYLKEEWKRNIGITISCNDKHNEILPFPLKITGSTKYPYSQLKPARSTQ